MNDAILVQLSFSDFKKHTSDALKLYRDGRLLELSMLALAYSSLVETSFLTGIPVSADVRGRTLQSTLHWAINRLRPKGQHSWTALNWRHYNILFYFYLERRRVSDLARLMGLAKQTLYQTRGDALTAISHILHEELLNAQDIAGRKRQAIADRYALLTSDSQLILRLTVAFRHSMPINLVHLLSRQSGGRNTQNAIHELVNANWLVTNERGTEVLAHPEVGDFLLTLLSPEERRSWHTAISQHYHERRDYWETARHLRWAGDYKQSAQILIQYQQHILNNMHVEDMVDMLSRFHRSELDDNLWVQLKIMTGDAALLMKDLDTALEEYRQALHAEDITVKALAYYRRAKAFALTNLDESLAHYAYCTRLLEGITPIDSLLGQVYIDRAWIFLEERQDLERAQADLQRAEQIVPAGMRDIWSNLHNAWLSLYTWQGDWDRAVKHGLQAWIAANETQDVNQMVNTSHNLGMTYTRLGKFDSALEYLNKSLDLAVQASNRQMEGLNSKTIGGCQFMLGRKETAVIHYQTAHDIFSEMGNENWQAHTCYDLAEVYGELAEGNKLKIFFDEGMALAESLGDERLLQEFGILAKRYQGIIPLAVALTERQLATLAVVNKEGFITNKQHQLLNGISSRQALRDLNEMVDKKLLIKTGHGRGTRYLHP
jgi:tetratricopeptide (TPR) repeat protein